jgi:hypothetical protein
MRRARSLTALAFAGALLEAACSRQTAAPPAGAAATDAAAAASWTAGICGAGDDAWCWAYPRPLGVRLSRLWGSGARDVWAVGEHGTIIHFDGERWASVPSGTTDFLAAIAGRGPGDAWAIGRLRTVLRLSGGAWRPVEVPKLENDPMLADIAVLPSGEAWVVGGVTKASVAGEEIVSRCLIGHHDGAAWRFDEDDPCGPLGRVWTTADGQVWADGGGDVVHWNGRYLTLNPKQKPAPIIGRHGFASGWKLEIEWAGGGAGRLSNPSRPQLGVTDVRDFWASGPDDVWAITKDGALTHFDGKRWSRGDEPNEVRAVAARAADDVWAITWSGTLLRWDGRSWRPWRLPAGANPSATALAAPASSDVWVTAGSDLLRFDGSRWTTVATMQKLTASSLFVRAPDDVWMAAGSKLFHWNGRALEAVDTAFNASRVFGDARGVWVGWPLHKWDGGKLVIPSGAAGPEGKGLFFADGAASGDAVWLAGVKRLARLEAGRLDVVKEVAGNLDAVWVSPSGEVWAGGAQQVVHGRGSSWTVEESPGHSEVKALGGADGLVWTLARQGPLGPHGLLFRR